MAGVEPVRISIVMRENLPESAWTAAFREAMREYAKRNAVACDAADYCRAPCKSSTRSTRRGPPSS